MGKDFLQDITGRPGAPRSASLDRLAEPGDTNSFPFAGRWGSSSPPPVLLKGAMVPFPPFLLSGVVPASDCCSFADPMGLAFAPDVPAEGPRGGFSSPTSARPLARPLRLGSLFFPGVGGWGPSACAGFVSLFFPSGFYGDWKTGPRRQNGWRETRPSWSAPFLFSFPSMWFL